MKLKILFFCGIASIVLGCYSPPRPSESPSLSGNDTEQHQKLVTAGKLSRASTQIALSDGPGIAGLFNKHYSENTTSCMDTTFNKVRGYYFCTGVVLRTVDNGNFDPWVPSPQALDFRATSFSWIRHDVNTNNLYLRAGFILLNLEDVLAGTIPGTTATIEFKCIYPFDAWTIRVMSRNYYGCNFEGTGLGSPTTEPWGSCDDLLKYTTSSQWDDNFQRHGQINYNQCSWNADNPQGWRNMIASHRNFAGQSSWNELMFYNWGHHPNEAYYREALRKWVTAFFYQSHRAGSLADAQTFQRKLAATGRRVPILKLDFSAPAANRFQYIAADQVMYP